MGLLINEGTQPSDDGQGYLTTLGIYTDAHIDGWRQITEAVHSPCPMNISAITTRAMLGDRTHVAVTRGQEQRPVKGIIHPGPWKQQGLRSIAFLI